MIPALLFGGFVLLVILAVPLFVVARIFSQLSEQERRIRALNDRVDSIASLMAERRPERLPPVPALFGRHRLRPRVLVGQRVQVLGEPAHALLLGYLEGMRA